MKKKVLSVLMCTAMTAAVLAGCGQSAAPAPAPAAPAAEEKKEEAPAEAAEAAPAEAAEGGFHFEIVSKGFQHQYWQAVLKGAEQKAAELGDTMNFVGPNSESDIADQVQMFNNAINANPAAIGLAALDTNALIDAIGSAKDAGVPIVGFDSGVPGAPEGAIFANAATNNYNAGVMAAEEGFKLIEDKLEAGSVIGVLSQDATSQSVGDRGLGFIDKMAELVVGKGLTCTVEGNDKFVNESKAEKTAGADVRIIVKVPAQVTSELSVIDCQNLLNEKGIVCIYGSNQHSAEAMVTANENLGKFGKDVVGIGFDSGAALKAAVADGTIAGAITQAPVAMGEAVIQLLHDAASGKPISDVDTGCQWYTKDNMNDPEISQNLYD